MKALNKETAPKAQRPERIIQFGEGNFLRAFVDWIIYNMNQKTDFNSNVVVVQPIDKGMVDMLNAQDDLYHVNLQGLDKGETINSLTMIDVISRALNPYTQNDEFMKLAEQPEMRFVISNTTEAGIEDVVHGRGHTADGAQVARSARIGDGLLAILCLNTLPLIGDFLDGLFPGNALPLAGAALAYTAHGILDAVGPVHVVDMAQASQADTVDAAVGERIELPLRRFDDLAVDDVQVQLAGAGAVAAAHAAEYLLTVALGLSCLIGRSLGEPARREGTRASGGHSGGSNTR